MRGDIFGGAQNGGVIARIGALGNIMASMSSSRRNNRHQRIAVNGMRLAAMSWRAIRLVIVART